MSGCPRAAITNKVARILVFGIRLAMRSTSRSDFVGAINTVDFAGRFSDLCRQQSPASGPQPDEILEPTSQQPPHGGGRAHDVRSVLGRFGVRQLRILAADTRSRRNLLLGEMDWIRRRRDAGRC